MPFLVAVDVTGTNSVTVRFQEPDSHDSPICTKFKVQWSVKEDFSVICGEREVLDMKQRECRIDDLVQGQKYHFRAAAGNLKGYSRFRNSTPAHVTPSSTIIFHFLGILFRNLALVENYEAAPVHLARIYLTPTVRSRLDFPRCGSKM